MAGLAQEGGVGGLGLHPPSHHLRLLPRRGEGGHHIEDRRPPRLRDFRRGAIHQPLMLHHRRHAARTGGEEVEGVVGNVALGLRREGGSEGAEQRREEECSQTAHVCSMRQDFVLSKWAQLEYFAGGQAAKRVAAPFEKAIHSMYRLAPLAPY